MDKRMSKELGMKFDTGKLLWRLLPWKALEEVVKVLTFGALKYAPSNWIYVKQADERYQDAALRHLTAYLSGEKLDPETGYSHLAHCICCLLFLLHFEVTGERPYLEEDK
jgi:hypothetical protein